MILSSRTGEARYLSSRGIAAGLLAGAAACALLCASAAAAQPPQRPRAIAVGETVTGSLDAADPKHDDHYYEAYSLRLREGESVQVDLVSEPFDAYLDVIAPGQSAEPLKSNDDGVPGSLNARLRFTAPAAGDYVLRAQGLNNGTGAYTLAVKTRIVLPPPPPVALVPGVEAGGTIAEQAPERDNGHRYVLYTYDGRAGDRVRIDMVSDKVDSLLQLTRADAPGGHAFSVENDDGGGDSNARIFAVLPESGRYEIYAQALTDVSGPYRVTLQRFAAPAGPPPPPAPLRRGAQVPGRLAFEDADLQIGLDDSGGVANFYKLYALPVAAGETVTVEMKSAAFDAVLDAGVMSPLGFAVARTNDDAEGTNARLVLTPAKSGPIILRARSLNADKMGGYTLVVTEGAPAPAAEAPPPPPHH